MDGTTLRKIRILTLAAETDPALDDGTRGRGVPNYLRALAISPDGTRLLAAAKKDNTFRGLARDGRTPTFETSVRSLLAVVDLETNAELPDLRQDIDNRSLPSALAFTSRGDALFLATEGTNHVGVYDGGGLKNVQSIIRDATKLVTAGGRPAAGPRPGRPGAGSSRQPALRALLPLPGSGRLRHPPGGVQPAGAREAHPDGGPGQPGRRGLAGQAAFL